MKTQNQNFTMKVRGDVHTKTAITASILFEVAVLKNVTKLSRGSSRKDIYESNIKLWAFFVTKQQLATDVLSDML